jgi:hypothetical protein
MIDQSISLTDDDLQFMMLSLSPRQAFHAIYMFVVRHNYQLTRRRDLKTNESIHCPLSNLQLPMGEESANALTIQIAAADELTVDLDALSEAYQGTEEMEVLRLRKTVEHFSTDVVAQCILRDAIRGFRPLAELTAVLSNNAVLKSLFEFAKDSNVRHVREIEYISQQYLKKCGQSQTGLESTAMAETLDHMQSSGWAELGLTLEQCYAGIRDMTFLLGWGQPEEVTKVMTRSFWTLDSLVLLALVSHECSYDQRAMSAIGVLVGAYQPFYFADDDGNIRKFEAAILAKATGATH